LENDHLVDEEEEEGRIRLRYVLGRKIGKIGGGQNWLKFVTNVGL
jgi:hypothetical protein